MNYFETNLEEISRSIQLLVQIFEYQVFELQVEEKDENQTGYVPYMMNDAIECYLSFHGLRISGKYDKDYEGEMWAQLEEREGRYGLIVHQGEESVFTMWFDEIMEHTNCYWYHEIGHFWREGAEQWRQLVYMIGTIREKYRFLGEEVCNDQEMEIMSLIEFAPFYYYFPINEDPEEWYEKSEEGLWCMRNLAMQAGDKDYLKWIDKYEKHPTKRMEMTLAKKLQDPKRQDLYELICEKVCNASDSYPARNYGERINEKIQRYREQVDKKLKEQGFMGTYPQYESEHLWVQVTEEHPFTILESEDFKFKIQLMISECRDKHPRKNAGFFNGWGRNGKIKRLDF